MSTSLLSKLRRVCLVNYAEARRAAADNAPKHPVFLADVSVWLDSACCDAALLH